MHSIACLTEGVAWNHKPYLFIFRSHNDRTAQPWRDHSHWSLHLGCESSTKVRSQRSTHAGWGSTRWASAWQVSMSAHASQRHRHTGNGGHVELRYALTSRRAQRRTRKRQTQVLHAYLTLLLLLVLLGFTEFTIQLFDLELHIFLFTCHPREIQDIITTNAAIIVV